METLEITLDAMRRNEVQNRKRRRFFLDFPTLRQCRSDFKFEDVERSLRNIGCIVLVLSPLLDPQTLKRIFCLFEVGAALRHTVDFEVVLPQGEVENLTDIIKSGKTDAIQQFASVNVEEAEIREGQEQIKAEILDVIHRTTTIEGTNRRVAAFVLFGIAKLACTLKLGTKTTPSVARFAAECAVQVQKFDPDMFPQILMLQAATSGYSLLHSALDDARTVSKLLELTSAAGVTQQIVALKNTQGHNAKEHAQDLRFKDVLALLDNAVPGLKFEPPLDLIIGDLHVAPLKLTNTSEENISFIISCRESASHRSFVFTPSSGTLNGGESLVVEVPALDRARKGRFDVTFTQKETNKYRFSVACEQAVEGTAGYT